MIRCQSQVSADRRITDPRLHHAPPNHLCSNCQSVASSSLSWQNALIDANSDIQQTKCVLHCSRKRPWLRWPTCVPRLQDRTGQTCKRWLTMCRMEYTILGVVSLLLFKHERNCRSMFSTWEISNKPRRTSSNMSYMSGQVFWCLSARVRELIMHKYPRRVYFCFYRGVCTWECEDNPNVAAKRIRWIVTAELFTWILSESHFYTSTSTVATLATSVFFVERIFGGSLLKRHLNKLTVH